jgi:hypothetical protein
MVKRHLVVLIGFILAIAYSSIVLWFQYKLQLNNYVSEKALKNIIIIGGVLLVLYPFIATLFYKRDPSKSAYINFPGFMFSFMTVAILWFLGANIYDKKF